MYIDFQDSLLNDIWLLFVGLLIGGLSLGLFRNYRLIRKIELEREKDASDKSG